MQQAEVKAKKGKTKMPRQNFYAGRLKTDIGASDVTIALDPLPTPTSGTLVIDARNPSQREVITYTGKAGDTITGVSRGQEGSIARTHAKNIVTEMNLTAKMIDDLYDAFASFAATNSGGWFSGLPAVTSVAYNGNKSYDLTFASSVAALVYPGYRLRKTRSVAFANRCLDLELSSSQSASRVSASVTGALSTMNATITVEANIKIESIGTNMVIASRQATSGQNGWVFWVTADGRLALTAILSTGNLKEKISSFTLPIGKWVHVAITLNMATDATTGYIDGLSTPLVTQNAGTAATFTNTGDMAIGKSPAGLYFDGKVTDVRVWNAIRTAAEIKNNSGQFLTGSESGLAGYWKLSGDLNDSTSSNNHLSGNNGAVATVTDSPSGNNGVSTTVDFGLVMAVSGSVATVQLPDGCTLPVSGGISLVEFATVKIPSGWPVAIERWKLCINAKTLLSQIATIATVYNLIGWNIAVPVGNWDVGYSVAIQGNSTGPTVIVLASLSLANNTFSDDRFTCKIEAALPSGVMNSASAGIYALRAVQLAAMTTFYFVMRAEATNNTIYIRGDHTTPELFAIPEGL